MRYQISAAERAHRRRRVLDFLARRRLDGLCLFGPTQIFYLSGFAFIATERPMVYALAASGATTLLVPRLEEEHCHTHADVDRVVAYPEYPGEKHPMHHLRDLLAGMGLARARLGMDSDGYPGVMGYQGPRLSEILPDATTEPARDIIENLIKIKSPEEIALIRESCRWGNLAHALLQERTRPGLTETEISGRASHEATMTMVRTLGPEYRPLSWTFPGAHAGFRGQIGKHSAIPHAMTTNARIQVGDVLVTGASAAVGGYHSELERTMVVGQPSAEVARYFQLMIDVQDAAFAAIRPGGKCSDVDRVVRAFFDRHDLWPYWRHHVGHALGMGVHEAPFFDVGDNSVIEPGMVFSVEPGIYVPDLGGFRHSDTLLVTETGIEMLTYYPRDLEAMTIPV
ncbi:MAG: aminopeptidase P family protein [Armatimonadetes bacterium]|nr:aminopeptidase P family protein [Armatimonadota bacterium]